MGLRKYPNREPIVFSSKFAWFPILVDASDEFAFVWLEYYYIKKNSRYGYAFQYDYRYMLLNHPQELKQFASKDFDNKFENLLK